VDRDRLRLCRRTAGIKCENGFRHASRQVAILFISSSCRLLSRGLSLSGVGVAFFFGAIQGSVLDQYPLTFVTLAGSAETNYDC
jgi:hypothetical protein